MLLPKETSAVPGASAISFRALLLLFPPLSDRGTWFGGIKRCESESSKWLDSVTDPEEVLSLSFWQAMAMHVERIGTQNAGLKSNKRGILLADLPDEPLVIVLQRLDDIRLLKMVTGLVCKSWCVGHIRPHVWCALGVHHNVHLTTGARMSLRSTVDQRKAFFLAMLRKQKVTSMHADAMISSLWTEMRKGDVSKGKLRKISVEAAFNVNHRLAMHSGWTAAFIAAWYGRLRTLKELVVTHHASISLVDINGFTPLCVAAWAGQAETVEWILKGGHDFGDLFQTGVPPMTSACGGKGPFTPWVWALRKKHWGVLERLAKFVVSARVEEPEAVQHAAKMVLAWGGDELADRLQTERSSGRRTPEKETDGDKKGKTVHEAVAETAAAAVRVVVHRGGARAAAGDGSVAAALQQTALPFARILRPRRDASRPELRLFIRTDKPSDVRGRIEQVLVHLIQCHQHLDQGQQRAGVNLI